MSSYAERIRGAAGFSSSRPDSVRVVSEIAAQTHRLREMGWNLTVAAMERFAGHRRGLGNKDFHMSASVRDLVARTGKGARSEVDAFAQSVMRAGHYTKDEADEIIKLYLGHEPSQIELRHHYAYVAIAAYYWYVWAIFQSSVGNNVGEYLYLWYKMAKNYCKLATSMYLNN